MHLVAIIKGRPADFQRVMTGGTQNLIAAAKAAGVERFVLMSALGTSETAAQTVPYYAAKWAEEREVRPRGSSTRSSGRASSSAATAARCRRSCGR